MPRGVKGSGTPKTAKSLDAKIAENDARIESLQSQLDEAKSKRKELQQLKGKSEIEAIHKIIHKSGMSANQLKELIEKNQAV